MTRNESKRKHDKTTQLKMYAAEMRGLMEAISNTAINTGCNCAYDNVDKVNRELDMIRAYLDAVNDLDKEIRNVIDSNDDYYDWG